MFGRREKNRPPTREQMIAHQLEGRGIRDERVLKTMAELPALWLESPRPPSALVASLPPALDALIQSLLRTDVDSRPRSAAR